MTLEDSADRGTVRVEDVADQLDMLTEGVTVYLDRDTNAFVTLLDPTRTDRERVARLARPRSRSRHVA